MVNVTVSIPEDLYKKMKKYSEVKWSEVVRKAVAEYILRLEVIEHGVMPSETLSAMLRKSGLDTSSVDLAEAIAYYEKGRKIEWKRSSTTQTSS